MKSVFQTMIGVIALICVTLIMVTFQTEKETVARAGELVPLGVKILSQRTAPDRTRILYCSLGSCENLGPTNGYTKAEWLQKIKPECDWSNSTTGIILASTEEPAADLALFYLLLRVHPILAMTGGAASMYLQSNFVTDDPRLQLAMRKAANLLPGLLSNEQSFPADLETIDLVKTGLTECIRRYEKRKRRDQLMAEPQCRLPLFWGELGINPDLI